MRATISARELAALNIKGLPATERGVTIRAEREGWPHIWEKCRGPARRAYLSHLLPPDIRQTILDAEKIDALVPATTGRASSAANLSQPQTAKAMLKADLLRIYLRVLAAAPWGRKDQARDQFMAAYNSAIAFPAIHEGLGDLSWKTIEGWKRTLKQYRGDTLRLADRRGYAKKGSGGLRPAQTDILLRCALRPNRPRISEAIKTARSVMAARGVANGYSDATYRRWLNDWKSTNHHIWTFSRQGAKAWNDNCAYYIERDYSLINVGDILVADGHVLNFEILNPWTGKPKRMALICWLDMKSTYPLGWEIMPTEDTAAISSALRRAILRLGRYPQVAYLDNGRAFKSRFFAGCDFEQGGFAGLYERLGMKTIFAWPYHGQSKTVERFFGSFAELERLCPTYTGTSIEKKPPRMMRGERLHRKVYEKAFGGQYLTMEQAHRAIAAWFDDYVTRPQRGHLAGRSPLELFVEEKGPGVDAAELRYLMMSLEVRHIHRNGISFQGSNYYDPALYGRRHPVTIRYDLQDLSALYVFDQAGEFLCEARQVEGVHPAATVLGDDGHREQLRQHIEFKRGQEKEAAVLAHTFLEQEVMPEHRRQLAAIGITHHQEAAAPALRQPPVYDEKKLLAEVEERGQQAADDSARDIRLHLERLSEPERYEALVEMEIKGLLIPRHQAAFMRYFEATAEYVNQQDYYETHRVKMTLTYQTQAAQ